GITDIVRRLDQSRLRAVRLIRWPMLLLPCLWMCALIPRAVTASPGESRVAERLARYRIDSGGAGATVVSRRSDTCFQLWYMTEIELRGYPDVVFQHLLSFPWYARDLVLRGLMPERILTYPFEDSRSWNAAATAALIMTRRLSRPIVILDPEILDDLVYAGFTLENPGCLPFGACLGPPNRIGVHYPIAFDPGMPMDLLSAQQMITEYIRQARFFELCGEPHRAHACRDAAMAIDRFGRQNEWWGS
ncbi:hypothetical protein JXA80_07620, partial [bacterium]|nr:hypothetical protein [candidate division CSSED10-310 bacterium]